MPSTRHPRLCFVNLSAYPALVPGYESHRIGGEEVQHSLLSTMFAAEGYDVQLVTADFGQEDGHRVQGVRVLRSFRQDAGVPVLRFLHPRWTRLDAALKRADADIYYVSCAGALVGWVAWFARRHGRRVIFRVASDTDCDPKRLLIQHARDRWLYHYGLRRSDAVLAQTGHQVELLKAHYSISSKVVPMVLDLPSTDAIAEPRDIDVLWVANLRALKRPELLIEVARRLPQYRFHLVGGATHDEPEVFQRVTALANGKHQGHDRGQAQLTLRGRLGYHETLALFRRARLFASTSLIEGFPNTFLQAWAREVPSISFFDPDGLVMQNGLGQRVESVEEMAHQIDTLLRDPHRLASMAAACGRYMRTNYARHQVLQPYADIFANQLAERTHS